MKSRSDVLGHSRFVGELLLLQGLAERRLSQDETRVKRAMAEQIVERFELAGGIMRLEELKLGSARDLGSVVQNEENISMARREA